MNTILVLAGPVIAIVTLVTLLRLRLLYSYLAIFLLGLLSPFAMDFLFCVVLTTACEPDALKLVAYVTMPLCVIPLSAVVFTLLPDRFKQKAKA